MSDKEGTKQERLFQDAPVWKAIGSLAVPSMIMMLVMIFYNMADMFFVAQTKDTAQVAAVSLVGPVFTIMMAIGNLLGGGACVLLAKSLGEKNYENVRLYSSLTVFGSLVAGVIFLVVVLVFRGYLLQFLGTNEETFQYAQDYLTVLAIGAPVMIFSTSFGGIIRAEGAVKEGMIGNLLSTVSNIVLDPLFILVFHLGAGGAAIATVLANVIGAIYYLWYLRFADTSFSIDIRCAAANPGAIARIISIGLPNASSNVLAGFASAFANNLLVQYGTDAVAAMAAAGKATMLISMIQMGITMGVQPMLAYCYGARNVSRMKETIWKLSVLTITIGLSVTLLCLFHGKGIISIFLKDETSLALGEEMIHLLVLSGPILGLYYLASTFLQASGNAPLATLTSVLRQGIFLVPLLSVMNHFFAVKGNVLAHVAADYAATAAAIILAVWQYRKLASAKKMGE